MDTSILDLLKSFRLSEYEAKAYLALLEKNTMGVADVSRIAGIPRTNAYEALEKLLAKGLCKSVPGKTKKYGASDPSIIGEKVTSEIENDVVSELEALDEKRLEIIRKKDGRVEGLQRLIRELTPLFDRNKGNDDPLEYIEVIKDPLLLHKRLIQLTSEAKVEILGFSKPPYSERKLLDEQVEQQRKLLKRGVKLRAIYEVPEDDDEKLVLLKNIESVMKRGEESRIIKGLPLKMMIFDERTVLFALEDPVQRKTSLTSLVIQHRSLARALKIVFETMWQLAENHRMLKGVSP